MLDILFIINGRGAFYQDANRAVRALYPKQLPLVQYVDAQSALETYRENGGCNLLVVDMQSDIMVSAQIDALNDPHFVNLLPRDMPVIALHNSRPQDMMAAAYFLMKSHHLFVKTPEQLREENVAEAIRLQIMQWREKQNKITQLADAARIQPPERTDLTFRSNRAKIIHFPRPAMS